MTPAGLILRALAVLSASSLLAAPVYAAPEDEPEHPRREQEAARPRHSLLPGLEILSEEQRNQIIVLMREQKEQIQAIHAEKIPPSEKDARVKEICEAFQVRVNDLLTPGQREKMEGFRARFRARFGDGAEKISDRIAEQLGLTLEQQEKFKALVAAQAESIRTVINNASASMPDKAARINEIRVETGRLLDEILSPEQRRIHEEIRAETRARFIRGQEKQRGRGAPGRDYRGSRPESHSLVE